MNETTASQYDHLKIEKKWQDHWLKNKTFRTVEDTRKPKYYVLDMFPYPSGAGLHVGHPEGYTATDIIARYKRMKGFNVLHPMGWDAFGLPAEQYAIKTGTHPRVTTDTNINIFREQIRALGLSYDWDREVDTTDPHYYKWTQWIFMKLYERGLAYESFEPVNWCPALGSVLANEEVIDGKSEIGGHPVVKKPMRQWVLKITEYAQRLLDDLEGLDWPESIKQMQRNWIGRSEGAEIDFRCENQKEKITVFSTRPDTLFGVSFLVLAPEHALVKTITTSDYQASVDQYCKATASRSDRDRLSDTKKTGVFTGAYALHPVHQQKIPIYIADYVLPGYGHGAVMGVPAHDERDLEFARLFSLPVINVVKKNDTSNSQADSDECYSGEGIVENSDLLNGLSSVDARKKIIEWLVAHQCGQSKITYKLRDWLFSRQRYWGEPIPIVHDQNGKPHLLSSEDLPLVLPELSDFKPADTGESALARAVDWVQYRSSNGEVWNRETNTMPQWAGSCWYYLRFLDPQNDVEAWSQEKEKYWMPVDLYIGGAEHAVLHLLYARFWHKVLFDLGYVSTKEPFHKLVNQGMILGENGEKMSKSRGNVVNPDDVIREWGADSLRLYEMFMGPLTATKPWQMSGIAGVNRFLKRAWRLVIDEATGGINTKIKTKESGFIDQKSFQQTLHRTIQKVGADIENLGFNTAISALMEFVNAAYKEESVSYESVSIFVKLLSPLAPHMAEELWERLGKSQSIAYEPWPDFDEALVAQNQIVMSIQVNGKMRGVIEVPLDITQDAAIQMAKEVEAIARQLEGKQIVKTIFVPGKIINLIAK